MAKSIEAVITHEHATRRTISIEADSSMLKILNP